MNANQLIATRSDSRLRISSEREALATYEIGFGRDGDREIKELLAWLGWEIVGDWQPVPDDGTQRAIINR